MVGRQHSDHAIAALLASVQLDLGISRLQRLRELESDLARHCTSEALAKVRIDIHSQLDVLSSLYKDHQNTWVAQEVAKRDQSLPLELTQFKRLYNSWTEPKCTQ
jgi:hypothetical protein